MSENVGASTSRNPKGLHGMYRDNFTLLYVNYNLGLLQRVDIGNVADVSEMNSLSFFRAEVCGDSSPEKCVKVKG
jgi:hypothetical protein